MINRRWLYFQKNTENQFDITERVIESDDAFEGNIEIIAFHIEELARAGEILKVMGLNSDSEYFYREARGVLSVPEKHVNNKGEGKLTFQSYFHGIPESLASINDTAIIVVALHTLETRNEKGQDYRMISYIHANLTDFKDAENNPQEIFYYNVLRISEFSENGVKLYRRKRIFSLVFSILHSLVDVRKIHFAYAAMGKENQAIDEALKMNSERYNKHWEKFFVRNNTKINRIFGSRASFSKLTDITDDEKLLKEMYKVLYHQKQNEVFFNLHTEEIFLNSIKKITSYSKTTRVFAIKNHLDKVSAAVVALNWGDYFSLQLENPKGFYKFIDSLKITEKILYPILMCGPAEQVNTLLKGIAYKYRTEHGVHVSLFNSYPGDPYEEIKKSVIFDNYQFFIISDRVEWLENIKNHSRDQLGNVKVFIEHPIL